MDAKTPKMERTSVSLPSELKARIKALADAVPTSEAEVIRELCEQGIAALEAEHLRPKRRRKTV